MKTQEEELIDILTDFKNSKYTLSEVNAIAEAWMLREDFQQARQHPEEALQTKSPDVPGLFGRIAKLFTSRKGGLMNWIIWGIMLLAAMSIQIRDIVLY